MSNLFLVLVIVSFSLLVLGLIKPKASLFWYKKERTRKKSFFTYLLSMILFFILFGITFDEGRLRSNRNFLNISKDSIKALIGKKVPYNKWDKWGFPKTLEGTDNQYWVVYLDSVNVSFVSDKKTDKILFADFDSISSINHLKNIKKKRKEMINKLLHRNGANSVSLKIMALIEKDLNDPDSMGNIEVNYVDNDSVIFVSQKFTAKNTFGGTLKKEVIVSIDTLGNITNIHKWID